MGAKPTRIFSFGQWTAGEDWRVQLAHDASDYTLLWTTRGQGRILLNGAQAGLGTHNAIAIPPNEVFAFDPGRQGIGFVALVAADHGFALPEKPRHLRLRETGAISEMTVLFETAMREFSTGRPLAQSALDAHMTLVSVWWQRQIALPDHLPTAPNAAARLAQRLTSLMSQPENLGLNVADYATRLSVTPTHLSRACKASTGRTAADLIAEYNLHSARRALTETDASVQDIARHLGFGSAAYFTRFVQTKTGQTPTHLRKTAAKAARSALSPRA